jgi:hypothetical protein
LSRLRYWLTELLLRRLEAIKHLLLRRIVLSIGLHERIELRLLRGCRSVWLTQTRCKSAR